MIEIVARGFGGPEVLSIVEEPIRTPGPEEVLIEVRAVGTNPVDYKVYSGAFGSDQSLLPIRLGMEASGVVRDVGNQAEGPTGPIEVGDEVVAYRIDGSYASEVVVPASAVLPKPSTFSFEEASGLLLAGSTAFHALDATGVGPGDTILVHGASGGVGLMAVQLAINAGARVIGTASPVSQSYLRQLGVEPTSYGDGLVERVRAIAPEGVDAVIDTVGGDEAIDASIALVADRARIATIAGFSRGFELGLKVLGGAPGADPGTAIRSAARLELVHLAESGKLQVRVANTFPLRRAADAHRELALGHTHGKIILIP